MSARWSCELCGGCDASEADHWHRTCECVLMRADDWALVRELWLYTKRRIDAGGWVESGVSRGAYERLDALFFAGEECRSDVHPIAAAGGEDSCS